MSKEEAAEVYRREQGADEGVDLGEDPGSVDDGGARRGLGEVGFAHGSDGREEGQVPGKTREEMRPRLLENGIPHTHTHTHARTGPLPHIRLSAKSGDSPERPEAEARAVDDQAAAHELSLVERCRAAVLEHLLKVRHKAVRHCRGKALSQRC